MGRLVHQSLAMVATTALVLVIVVVAIMATSSHGRVSGGGTGSGTQAPAAVATAAGPLRSSSSSSSSSSSVSSTTSTITTTQNNLTHQLQYQLIQSTTTTTTNTATRGLGHYSFRIVQIADIHLGERPDTFWGGLQDEATYQLLDTILRPEHTNNSTQLLVLSGDQLTGNDDMDHNGTARYKQLGQFLSKYQIPWALIFGNHDDAPVEQDVLLPNGTTYSQTTPNTDATRAKLLATQASFPLSLTQAGPTTLPGVSNYWLDVYLPPPAKSSSSSSQQQKQKPVTRLLFLDSGGGSLPQSISASQVEWFKATHDPNIPTVAFQHIPTQQFGFHYNGTASSSNSNNCQGFNGEGGFAPLADKDAGIVDALSSAHNVAFLAVGHNHGNDYCCPIATATTTQTGKTNSSHNSSPHINGSSTIATGHPLHVCFGRHSGYGGYGSWERGVRIYELFLDSNGTWLGFKSWVHLENGTVTDQYNPYQLPY